MARVTKIDREIGNGCTEPLLGMIEIDGAIVQSVIKTKDNIQGTLSIINELICYEIASAVGLNMPRSGVAMIGHDCNIADGLLDASSYGSCFYSEYVKSTVLNPGVISSIKNTEMFQEIIVFDHVVYNADRNLGNLLLTSNKGDKILFAIDHTHAFKNGTIWTSFDLNIGMVENDYLDNVILKRNGYIYNMFFGHKNIGINELKRVADNYKAIITRELIESTILKIPNDWNINIMEINTLKDYILYRVSHLDDICNMIIDYKNGGEVL